MSKKCGLFFKQGILLLFMSLFTLQVSALAQVSITMDIKDATIDEIITNVRRETNLRFLYRVEEVSKYGKRDLNVRDAGINEVLEQLLKGTELSYSIENGVVIISPVTAVPQEVKAKVIKGKVVDEHNQPLPGVTILLKGVVMGTVANVDGQFSLEVPADKDVVLVVSFMGMETQEVSVPKDFTRELKVVMKQDVKQMDEVVVTGFTNIRKESFTGNSVTISKDDLMKVSKTNVIKALQTFDPSFRIQENNIWGSDPNALPEVYIRGKSGIGVKELDPGRSVTSKSALKDNPNLPTFIMDGFEISVTKLYDFDPSRIESVTILKDAAATALYGSRAANGVVVITTVAPKPGKLNVSYNMTGEISIPDLRDYNLLNAEEKLEAEVKSGFYDDTQNTLLMQEYAGKLYNVKNGVNTYWLSKPLRTAFSHKHSLYIDGGTDKLRFGVEMSYNNSDGVMKGSLRDNYGAGFYLDYQLGSFRVRNHVTYDVTRSKESPYGDFADYASRQPYDVYKDENGRYLEQVKDWHMSGRVHNLSNPLYESTLNNFDHTTIEELKNDLSLVWYITSDLQVKGAFSVSRQMQKGESFLDPLSKKNSNPLSLANVSSGELRTNDGNNLIWDLQAILSYNKFIEKHNINFSAGFNARSDKAESTSAYYRGFPSGLLHSVNYAQEIYQKPTKDESSSRLIGFTGLLNYSYNNIYLFDASVRLDGSSKFGADKKFAPFWSVGAGLNIHNYEFMRGISFLDQLKVRGSYGQTGKVNFSPYDAKTSYEIFNDEWYKTGYGATLKALGNTKLTWETTNTLDVGIEMSFLQRLIYVKASYYNKRTVDLINNVTVPSSTGFTTYIDNIGEIENKGFELDFRSDLLRRNDWYVALYANLAHNKNKILKISESLKAYNESVNEFFDNRISTVEGNRSQPHHQYTEGGSESSIWGVRSMGIDPATGNEVFVRKDGTLTNEWSASDQVIIGNTEPKAQGSFGINVSYKNFSLYASFMYEFGGQAYNSTLVSKVEEADIYNYNVDRRVLTERWAKPGDVAKYKKLPGRGAIIETTYPTSRFVQDYNWLTLNSLSLGYDFDQKLINRIGLSMLRFEIGSNDLGRWSTVKQERGLSYPFARSVNFSLKATF